MAGHGSTSSKTEAFDFNKGLSCVALLYCQKDLWVGVILPPPTSHAHATVTTLPTLRS